ncbi:MAG: hypothetical protein IJ274_00100, partial [Lachnospiraceae bacterium]|nr:hypothetical protein [Lachnospiraceae bacterium]
MSSTISLHPQALIQPTLFCNTSINTIPFLNQKWGYQEAILILWLLFHPSPSQQKETKTRSFTHFGFFHYYILIIFFTITIQPTP